MRRSSTIHRSPAFFIKRIIGGILLVALAAIFILSAWSKIYSHNALDSFVWTFLDLGINSIATAGIIARVMIGLEFLTGLFLLCHIFLKAFTYPAVIVLLTAFTGYLGIVLFQQGNTGNCGCFGDVYAMTPVHAIYKNVIMAAVTILLIYIYPIRPFKNQEWIAPLIGMAALVTPFIVAPFSTDTQPEAVNKTINLSPLYANVPKPGIELRKGKHIIAFLSLTCPHCRKAAYLMQVIQKQHPEIPMFIVLNGPEMYKEEFLKETHITDVPYMLYTNTDKFIEMAGSSVPAVYWITDGFVSYKTTYYQMDPKRMLTWMKN